MASQLFAAIGLIVCVLLGLHMMLGPVRQRRLAAWWSGYQHRFARWNPILSAEARAEARRHARARTASQHREAIERARSRPMPLDEVEWDGNVAKPKFGGSRSSRTLH